MAICLLANRLAGKLSGWSFRWRNAGKQWPPTKIIHAYSSSHFYKQKRILLLIILAKNLRIKEKSLTFFWLNQSISLFFPQITRPNSEHVLRKRLRPNKTPKSFIFHILTTQHSKSTGLFSTGSQKNEKNFIRCPSFNPHTQKKAINKRKTRSKGGYSKSERWKELSIKMRDNAFAFVFWHDGINFWNVISFL